MGNFSIQLQRQIEHIKQQKNLAFHRIALEAYQKIQSKSPVDTGALRRSWTVAVNSMPTNYNGSKDSLYSATFSDVIMIATDKPYAPALEYGLYPNPPKARTGKTVNGYSKQAPAGMVRITIAEIKAFLARNPQLGVS